MIGAKPVRVVNDMTMYNRLWLYLKTIAFVLILASFAGGVIFAVVAGGTPVGKLELGINGLTYGLSIFISVMLFIGSIFFGFLTWLFNRFYNIDVPLPPRVSEKLQKKLQKYEYKKLKRQARTHKRWDNQELKKKLMQEYKNNKQ